tara:strand:- start:402 stop:560 length:159 start_codon:yes stop_codon:yes gene_type:complete
LRKGIEPEASIGVIAHSYCVHYLFQVANLETREIHWVKGEEFKENVDARKSQ